MSINRTEIANLTMEYGGQWGINHTQRLLQLIIMIGEGLEYNSEAVWAAAHLHDWGGYSRWMEKDVDHAVRSAQVAEAFLTERGCPQNLMEVILEAIKFHHNCAPDRRIESILLSDADALDFLGIVGILRDFSKNPKDLRKAYDVTRRRREKLPGMLILDRSKEIAAERLQQMDEILARFEQDSFGFF